MEQPFWFITYCNNTSKRNNYSLIYLEDYNEARQFVFDTIGDNWAFMYSTAVLQEQIDRFGLTEITL